MCEGLTAKLTRPTYSTKRVDKKDWVAGHVSAWTMTAVPPAIHTSIIKWKCQRCCDCCSVLGPPSTQRYPKPVARSHDECDGSPEGRHGSQLHLGCIWNLVTRREQHDVKSWRAHKSIHRRKIGCKGNGMRRSQINEQKWETIPTARQLQLDRAV